MGQISLSIPQVGAANSTEDVKVANDFTTVQNVINGNLDGTNLSAALAQSAAVNQAGQTVKGASVIATSESRTNTAYGTMPTADQVTGIVLPTNGLIAVWYQATWQESVSGAARATIFIGSNQVRYAMQATAGSAWSAALVAAYTNSGTAGLNRVLTTAAYGLSDGGNNTIGYGGDVTTGQIVGNALGNAEADGAIPIVLSTGAVGGPCEIFAAAGTYTVSVQFKASSGSVTASNRKLWVQALSFA